MNRGLVAIGGAALGAGTMYLFDPARGRRRRARVRGAAVHASHTATAVAGRTARDVGHRLSGLAARGLAHLVEEPRPDDVVLEERVRARLGRLVSHPHAIAVAASNGTITLKGPIFQAEVDQLLKGVGSVAGVTAVDNRLDMHEEAGHVSALQGPGPRKVAQGPEKWLRWTPTARVVAGVAGLVLLAVSSPKRPIRGAATGITGVELLERAVLGRRAP